MRAVGWLYSQTICLYPLIYMGTRWMAFHLNITWPLGSVDVGVTKESGLQKKKWKGPLLKCHGTGLGFVWYRDYCGKTQQTEILTVDVYPVEKKEDWVLQNQRSGSGLQGACNRESIESWRQLRGPVSRVMQMMINCFNCYCWAV